MCFGRSETYNKRHLKIGIIKGPPVSEHGQNSEKRLFASAPGTSWLSAGSQSSFPGCTLTPRCCPHSPDKEQHLRPSSDPVSRYAPALTVTEELKSGR